MRVLFTPGVPHPVETLDRWRRSLAQQDVISYPHQLMISLFEWLIECRQTGTAPVARLRNTGACRVWERVDTGQPVRQVAAMDRTVPAEIRMAASFGVTFDNVYHGQHPFIQHDDAVWYHLSHEQLQRAGVQGYEHFKAGHQVMWYQAGMRNQAPKLATIERGRLSQDKALISCPGITTGRWVNVAELAPTTSPSSNPNSQFSCELLKPHLHLPTPWHSLAALWARCAAS